MLPRTPDSTSADNHGNSFENNVTSGTVDAPVEYAHQILGNVDEPSASRANTSSRTSSVSAMDPFTPSVIASNPESPPDTVASSEPPYRMARDIPISSPSTPDEISIRANPGSPGNMTTPPAHAPATPQAGADASRIANRRLTIANAQFRARIRESTSPVRLFSDQAELVAIPAPPNMRMQLERLGITVDALSRLVTIIQVILVSALVLTALAVSFSDPLPEQVEAPTKRGRDSEGSNNPQPRKRSVRRSRESANHKNDVTDSSDSSLIIVGDVSFLVDGSAETLTLSGESTSLVHPATSPATEEVVADGSTVIPLKGFIGAVFLVDCISTEADRASLVEFKRIRCDTTISCVSIDCKWMPSFEIDTRQPIGLLTIGFFDNNTGYHTLSIRTPPDFKFEGDSVFIKELLEDPSVTKVVYDFEGEQADRLSELGFNFPKESICDLKITCGDSSLFTQLVQEMVIDGHRCLSTRDAVLISTHWSNCTFHLSDPKLRVVVEDAFFKLLIYLDFTHEESLCEQLYRYIGDISPLQPLRRVDMPPPLQSEMAEASATSGYSASSKSL